MPEASKDTNKLSINVSLFLTTLAFSTSRIKVLALALGRKYDVCQENVEATEDTKKSYNYCMLQF